MGAATLDLTTLDLSRPTDISLPLQDPARPDTSLGEILLSVTLMPKSQEDKEQVGKRRNHSYYALKNVFSR